jgi:D-threo-aldose 1-dehydrogenase
VKLHEVGRLALGCAAFGNLYEPVTDDAVQACVDTAWDRGVRLFDTAPLYGHGSSETRLGNALRGRARDDYLIATKVGRLLVPTDPAAPPAPTIFADLPPVTPVFDFSADGTLRSVEASLERLGLDRIDLLHVHDPDDHLAEAVAGAYPALVRLRDEGLVQAVGLGTNHASVAAHVLERVDLDWLLLAGRCTLLDRTGPDEVFDACVARDVRVLAAGVFNSGVLAAPGPGAPFHYAPAPPEVLAHVAAMRSVCEAHGVPLAAAALQFPLRFPAVTTVLVGARSGAEMAEDHDLLHLPIPDALWDELSSLHPQET